MPKKMSEFDRGVVIGVGRIIALDRARELAREKPSTSYLQRKMLIPYSAASEIMNVLEKEGVVSKRNSAGKRTVIG